MREISSNLINAALLEIDEVCVEKNNTETTNVEGQSSGQENLPHHEQVEDYGGGHIQARHGRINSWLLVVYVIMFVWALYYGYEYWGGLGPGLDY